MLLLSSLLGPAKPPVASNEDVASAEGTYRVRVSESAFIAAAVNGPGQIDIGAGEQCLVCLEEYRPDEELRRLNNCSHLFHRDCIDMVCRIVLSHLGPSLICYTDSGLRRDEILARFVEAKVLMKRTTLRLNPNTHLRLVRP